MHTLHKALGSIHNTAKRKKGTIAYMHTNLHRVSTAVFWRRAKIGIHPISCHLMNSGILIGWNREGGTDECVTLTLESIRLRKKVQQQRKMDLDIFSWMLFAPLPKIPVQQAIIIVFRWLIYNDFQNNFPKPVVSCTH